MPASRADMALALAYPQPVSRTDLGPATCPAEPDAAYAPWGNGALAELLPPTCAPDGRFEPWGPGPLDPFPAWAEDDGRAECAVEGEGARPVLSGGPPPPGLGRDLVRALGEASATFATLDAAVAAAPVEERRAAYRSAAVQAAIAGSALSPAEKLALSTALAEGSLQWRITQGGSDFYAFFALADGRGTPPPMERMSCFELILYAAWMLGQLTAEQIVALYRKYPNSEVEHVDYADLGFSPSLPTWSPNGGRPAPGDLVFAVSAGRTEPRHVLLSLGGDAAMSLDKVEGSARPAARVSLADEAPGHTLYYGPARWLVG